MRTSPESCVRRRPMDDLDDRGCVPRKLSGGAVRDERDVIFT